MAFLIIAWAVAAVIVMIAAAFTVGIVRWIVDEWQGKHRRPPGHLWGVFDETETK